MCISAGLALGLGSIAAGAGATIYSANKASSAQKRATDAATQYQYEALDWEKEKYEEDVARRKPYYDLSLEALPGLRDYINGDFDITKTQEYQTQSKALDRELASHLSARGLQLSGFGVEEDARLKTGLQSNLYNQRFSRLSTLANLGSTGMAQAPNLGQYYSNLGNIAMQQGQQQSSMYGSMAQLPFNAMNAYSMWKWMNKGTVTPEMTPEMTAWDMY